MLCSYSEVAVVQTLLDQELTDLAATESGPELNRQLNAWTAVARMLLNLDEFITRE